MMEILPELAVLASEEFVPPTDWRAQIAVPTGILILLGGVFMLLRANLGTRRAYLLQASTFFGFMLMISLFWAFGAPGTPAFTGPQNLPGQPLDYYQPKWVPFAQDSVVAEQPEFDVVQQYPEGFSEVPEGGEELEQRIDDGVGDIQTFFARDEAGGQVGEDWVAVDQQMAESGDGRMLLAVEYAEPDPENPLEPAEDAATYVAFGFFDEGNLFFPSLVFIVLSGTGFGLHLLLLGWDENQARREIEEDLAAESEGREKVPTPA